MVRLLKETCLASLLTFALAPAGEAASIADVEPAPVYAVEFGQCQLGASPEGWTDVVDYRPSRNWARDGLGFLRVMLKEYVGNPIEGDRLVRREYLEQYGVTHFSGLLAYTGALADGRNAQELEDVRLLSVFKKTPDPNVFFGLFARMVDRDNYLAARFLGSNQLQLVRVNQGEESVLATQATRANYAGGGLWTMELALAGNSVVASLRDEQGQEQARLEFEVGQTRSGLVGLNATTFAAARRFEILNHAHAAQRAPLRTVLETNAVMAQLRGELDYPVVEPVDNVDSLNTPFTALASEYDVVVAGAGTGGWAAAVQAARLGAKVLLLEETDWIGGQLAAAAVTSMDEGGIWGKNTVRERGIYREFHESVVNHYYTNDKDPFAAYHFNRQSEGGYEPRVARGVLYGLIQETRQRSLANGRRPVLDLCVRTKVAAVEKDKNAVRGVTIEEWTEAGPRVQRIKCHVLVDATEYGDVLPLAGARYRLGTNISDSITPTAAIQAHTWLGVIREYPGGVPEHLKIKTPPPGFAEIEKRFRKYRPDGVRIWGGAARGDKRPRHWSVYVDWRGMADSASPATGEATEQWHSRCGLNGGNDYEVTAATVENREQRLADELSGINMTLGIIYWFQHTLQVSWGVAEDEGYCSPLNVALMKARGVREDLVGIASHLPQHPYVRESRRMIGVQTLRASDIATRDRAKEKGRHWSTAVAINDYSVDLHGTRDQIELDLDSPDYVNATGPFQVPFGAFIPEQVDGLLPAEKNFSQSRLVNGATRLQPSTMLTGQAVGVMAALSVQNQIPVRDLNIIEVQSALLAAGDTLVSRWYSDVSWGTPLWQATQLLSLYGIMDRPGPMERVPLGEIWQWGVNEPLTATEVVDTLARTRELFGDRSEVVTRLKARSHSVKQRGDFALVVAQVIRDVGTNRLTAPVPHERR